jgi:hypothetical protein
VFHRAADSPHAVAPLSHGKVMGAFAADKSHCTVYVGSHNFTRNAWGLPGEVTGADRDHPKTDRDTWPGAETTPCLRLAPFPDETDGTIYRDRLRTHVRKLDTELRSHNGHCMQAVLSSELCCARLASAATRFSTAFRCAFNSFKPAHLSNSLKVSHSALVSDSESPIDLIDIFLPISHPA